MKTPKEFDYDLWKDEKGKCYIRVKRTGEVCEVNEDTFRVLRNEEKKIRREQEKTKTYKKNGITVNITINLLSLDFVDTESEVVSRWLEDKVDYEDMVITKMLEEKFKTLLTEKQLDVLENCLIKDISIREYARLKGVHKSSVDEIVKSIRKKFNNFFE